MSPDQIYDVEALRHSFIKCEEDIDCAFVYIVRPLQCEDLDGNGKFCVEDPLQFCTEEKPCKDSKCVYGLLDSVSGVCVPISSKLRVGATQSLAEVENPNEAGEKIKGTM